MENSEAMQPERRHEPRLDAIGTAIVHGELPALRTKIVDISGGGMLVQTGMHAELAPWRDRAVAVDIRIDGLSARWLTAIGRVRRLEVASGRVAVQFDTVPTELQGLLAAEATACGDRDIRATVILVDSIIARREPIAGAFREAGCTVIEVSSTLDALVRLGKSRYAPELIVLGDAIPERVAEELRDFLSTGHPGARVVAIEPGLAPTDAWIRGVIDAAISFHDPVSMVQLAR